jgi:hypothetical protein
MAIEMATLVVEGTATAGIAIETRVTLMRHMVDMLLLQLNMHRLYTPNTWGKLIKHSLQLPQEEAHHHHLLPPRSPLVIVLRLRLRLLPHHPQTITVQYGKPSIARRLG